MLVKAFLLVCTIAVPYVLAVRLRILHTNDMHSHFDETSELSGKCMNTTNCYGGLPRIIAEIKQQKNASQTDGVPLLVLNAGDTFQGTLWYSVNKWKMVAAFTKMMQLDAMCLGIHEFDDGPEGLAPYIKEMSDVEIVATNINGSSEPAFNGTNLLPEVTLSFGNITIGIVGYLTPEARKTSRTGNLMIHDEITSLTEEVRKLKTAGINIIIALGHSGYDKDKEIAAKVPGVDIVVGGRSHTFLFNGETSPGQVTRAPYPTIVTQESGHRVAVVQAYAYTKYLGLLEVEFDKNWKMEKAAGQPILLDNKKPQDKLALDELEKWKPKLAESMNKTIGKSTVALDGNCLKRECNLGNLITDAFVDYAKKHALRENGTKAMIGIYNGGGIKSSMKSGGIVLNDLVQAIPYFNPLLLLSIKGKQLLHAFEKAGSNYTTTGLLQISGVELVYNDRKPEGSRVVNASVCEPQKCSPIKLTEDYNVVSTSYIAYKHFNITNYAALIMDFGVQDTNVVADFIKNKTVSPHVDGRIKFVKPNSGEYPRASFIFIIFLSTACYHIINM